MSTAEQNRIKKNFHAEHLGGTETENKVVIVTCFT